MPPVIEKILFTSDLTDTSKHAFSYAASMAERYCAQIVFLYVMEDVPHSAKGFLDAEVIAQIRSRAVGNAMQSLIGKRQDMALVQSGLRRFCESVRDGLPLDGERYPAAEVVVREGNVVDEIIAVAAEFQCDTIVMGSARRGTFAEAMLGSVLKGVLKRSDAMVVVAPPLKKA
ncbi:MAG: hypothetical protein VR64_10770 [Desulfatitalea sp. BRH_c12]|nr:MAG: hypothetical protein VR64_10770 [Desulfatitalea sp. BRH_c12]